MVNMLKNLNKNEVLKAQIVQGDCLQLLQHPIDTFEGVSDFGIVIRKVHLRYCRNFTGRGLDSFPDLTELELENRDNFKLINVNNFEI
jgi:hypothetical protein